MEEVQKKSLRDVQPDELFAVEGGNPGVLAGYTAGQLALMAGMGVATGVVGTLAYNAIFGQKSTSRCDNTSAEANTAGVTCDCTKGP